MELRGKKRRNLENSRAKVAERKRRREGAEGEGNVAVAVRGVSELRKCILNLRLGFAEITRIDLLPVDASYLCEAQSHSSKHILLRACTYISYFFIIMVRTVEENINLIKKLSTSRVKNKDHVLCPS